jgi:uncharacterized protein (DUF1800 family)
MLVRSSGSVQRVGGQVVPIFVIIINLAQQLAARLGTLQKLARSSLDELRQIKAVDDHAPSEADIKVTHKLIRAGQLLEIDALGTHTTERAEDSVSLRELDCLQYWSSQEFNKRFQADLYDFQACLYTI